MNQDLIDDFFEIQPKPRNYKEYLDAFFNKHSMNFVNSPDQYGVYSGNISGTEPKEKKKKYILMATESEYIELMQMWRNNQINKILNNEDIK